MEPAASSAILHTLLMTLAEFLSLRESDRAATADSAVTDYLEWLRRKDHRSLIAYLEGQNEALKAIDAKLNAAPQELLSELRTTSALLGQFVAGSPTLGQLGRSLPPSGILSDQAMRILAVLHTRRASFMIETGSSRDPNSHITDGDTSSSGNQVPFDEPRFVRDDIDSLCMLGLLDPDFNGRSKRYLVTRRGDTVGAAYLNRSGIADAAAQ